MHLLNPHAIYNAMLELFVDHSTIPDFKVKKKQNLI